ncbi:MAG: thermonuclease family protein [Acidobacteriota bacterium]|nr:thermonuclease family protein [Acidobacteriota bacterium]
MPNLPPGSTAVVACLAIGVAMMPSRSPSLAVRAVTDGRTIVVGGVGRVRLLGLAAPQRQGGGRGVSQEARRRLADLVLRRWVRLEPDGRDEDPLRAHAAYVFRDDGQFINLVMVREGFARVTARGAGRRLVELQRAEREARQARRGLWREDRAARARPPGLYFWARWMAHDTR